MSAMRTAVAGLAATVVAGGVLVAAAQQPARGNAPTPGGAVPQGGTGQTPSQLPLSQTVRDRGTSVTGSFEGWYHGKDGSDYAFLGYFNRNTKQELDIPVGPNNRIEPGGPDQGQPTHFLTGRQRGVFAIRLPKDLGSKKLVWTIVSNGFTNTITVQTYPTYIIEPYMNSTTKAIPPVLRFDPSGPTFSGPPQGFAAAYAAAVTTPLTLTTYLTGNQGRGGGGAAGAGRGRGASSAPPGAEPSSTGSAPASADGTAAQSSPSSQPSPAGRGGAARGGRGGAGNAAGAAAGAAGLAGRGSSGGAVWTKYRGPGSVTFAAIPRPAGEPAAADGKAQTRATFDAPGDYVLRVQAGSTNGEQCCWTNAHVKVTVQPAAGSK